MQESTRLTDADRLFRRFQTIKYDPRQASPTINVFADVDLTAAQAWRRQRNERSRGESPKLTLTHLVLKAVANTLRQHPIFFSYFDGRRLRPNRRIALSVPVAVGNHVEYVLLRDPDRASLEALAGDFERQLALIASGRGEFKRTISRYRFFPDWVIRLGRRFIPALTRQAARRYYGNFSVSNFGTFGADSGTLALALPFVASLCFGRAREVPYLREGALETRTVVTFNMAFDHRAIDGAPAGAFLSDLRRSLEEPSSPLFAREEA